MQLDKYTKALLTVAVLFLGVIAFDYKLDIQAQAGIMGGGSEMIIPTQGGSLVHMKDGKLRFCGYKKDSKKKGSGLERLYFVCSNWDEGTRKR